MTTAYKAFISYSHAADGKLAPMLQQGLQQFARPWNQLRALRVFRDKTGLTATPALWNSIVAGLDSAEYFLLLASPQAAQSQWVDQEVRHWLSQPRAERLLIILTDGEIVWDHETHRLDADRTNALPPALRQFTEEPLWLDLRWARHSDQVSLQNPAFREIVADLSSVLRGIPKDQLIGEDVRQHRRATALRRAAITGLTILTLGLAGTAYVALQQRNFAQEQARIALGRQLAAQSELIRASQPERFPLALMMAAEAARSDPTSSEAQQTLQALLSQFPEPAGTLTAGSGNVKVAVDPQFRLVAASTKDGGALWRLPDRTRVATLPAVDQLVISGDARRVAGCCRTVEVWDSNGVRELSVDSATLSGRPVNIALTRDGKRLAIAFDGRGPGFAVWDVDARQMVFRREISLSGNAPVLAFAPNGDLAVTMRTTIELLRSGAADITPLATGTDGLHTLAYSPDGRYLAWSSTRSVVVYDVSKGAEAGRLTAGSGDAPGGSGVDRLFFSHDGEYLGGVGSVNTSAIWRAPNWREVLAPRHAQFRTINALAFDPSTPQAATCDSDGYCFGWSLETKQKTYRFAHQYAFEAGTAAQPQILDAIFSPTGSTLLTAGADGTVRFWNVTPPAEAGRGPCDAEPVIRPFTPGGRHWFRSGGFIAAICTAGVRNPDDATRSVITDPDNKYSASVAAADVVRVRRLADGALLAELVHADPIDWDAVQERLIRRGMSSPRAYLPEIANMKSGGLHVHALSPSGKYLITRREGDETLRVWDITTKEVVLSENPSKESLVLDFLSDTQFVRAEPRESISIVDVTRRAPVWSGPLGSLEALTVSGDRRLLAWADESERKSAVHLREAASGRALLDRPVGKTVDSIHLDRNNEFLVVTVGRSTMVPEGLPLGVGLHVWRVADGKELVSIDEAEKVIAFNFAPNAPSLAVVTRDGGVRVWDLRSGRMMSSVVGNPGPVAFGLSGRWIAIGSTSVQVLDSTSLKPVAQLTFAANARRLEFTEDDRVLAVSVFEQGSGRGLTYRRYWQLADILTEACKRLPLTAAQAQWKQLLGNLQLPSPCSAGR